jgi:hypothetical protein
MRKSVHFISNRLNSQKWFVAEQVSISKVGFLSNQYHRLIAGLIFLALVPTAVLIQGCGGSAPMAGTQTKPATPTATLAPSSASIQEWQSVQFTVSGEAAGEQCTWQSSQPSILVSLGSGQFQGAQSGTAQVTVTCGSTSSSASVVVSPQQAAAPIEITSGGTYSGNWNSTDPSTPAVKIRTDQPVILQDSVISGPGTLIDLSGVSSGANVTIQNVTGTALDPGVSGEQRGSFLTATKVEALTVKNCTIVGASFGVKLAGATPSTLEITNNQASNLEDRASDGRGGFLPNRPSLGHFIILNNVLAPNGAEIAWNQDVQTIGQSSTEDVVNIYNSQGVAGHPIWVHDNYFEGSSSPVIKGHYTGTAMVTDGTGTNGAEPTAFVHFEANEVVATAGTGVGIAAGHDITADANRIVSCGVTGSGDWYAWGANGIVIWNYYNSTQFYNNTITGTVGGMVGPGTNDAPTAFDVWANPPDMLDPGNSVSGNDFTNPCLTNGSINLQAEDAERAFWAAKILAANEVIGDQHLN